MSFEKAVSQMPDNPMNLPQGQTQTQPRPEHPILNTVEAPPEQREEHGTQEEPKSKVDEEYEKKVAELTSKFDSVSMRERRILQREQQLKDQMAKMTDMESLRKEAKSNPAAVMEKLGVTYDELTDFFASQAPEDETTKTIGTLKKEIEELKKQQELEKQQGQMREVAKVKEQKIENIKNLANKEGSEYGLVAAFGSYEDVFNEMAKHYQTTGEILDDETVLQQVEQQLQQNLKELAKNPKVRQLLGIAEQQQPVEPKEVMASQTLSNNSFNAEAPKTESTRRLSEAQLFELALSKIPDLKS